MRHSSEATLPVLCADDFGIAPGVSSGIEELAAAGRISAASAIVTLPTWPKEGLRLAALREHIAIGLHVNLTLGAPLAPMLGLAPSGSFPPVRDLVLRCFWGEPPDPREVAFEVQRQIARFEDCTGSAPDFIDGHQHIHVLPGIRDGFLHALQLRFPEGGPLIRDPRDNFTAIVARRRAMLKALSVSVLASGFGTAIRRAGFPTNVGFAGFSNFSPAVRYSDEFEGFFHRAGTRHLIMCHPGYPDAELSRLDPLVDRRRDELDWLLAAPALDQRIWHVGARRRSGQLIWTDVGETAIECRPPLAVPFAS